MGRREELTFDGGAGGLSSEGGGGARTDGSGIAGREPVLTSAWTKGPGKGNLGVSSPQERLEVGFAVPSIMELSCFNIISRSVKVPRPSIIQCGMRMLVDRRKRSVRVETRRH